MDYTYLRSRKSILLTNHNLCHALLINAAISYWCAGVFTPETPAYFQLYPDVLVYHQCAELRRHPNSGWTLVIHKNWLSSFSVSERTCFPFLRAKPNKDRLQIPLDTFTAFITVLFCEYLQVDYTFRISKSSCFL